MRKLQVINISSQPALNLSISVLIERMALAVVWPVRCKGQHIIHVVALIISTTPPHYYIVNTVNKKFSRKT